MTSSRSAARRLRSALEWAQVRALVADGISERESLTGVRHDNPHAVQRGRGELAVGHVLGPCHRQPLGHRVPPLLAVALTLDVSPRGCAWNSSVADRRPMEGSAGVARRTIGRDRRPSAEETVSPPRARSPRHLRGVGIALRLDPRSSTLPQD